MYANLVSHKESSIFKTFFRIMSMKTFATFSLCYSILFTPHGSTENRYGCQPERFGLRKLRKCFHMFYKTNVQCQYIRQQSKNMLPFKNHFRKVF